MIKTKQGQDTFTVTWRHSRKNKNTYCSIFSEKEGLLTIAEVSNCNGNDCLDTTFGKKESLKAAILRAIPREQYELRKKIWDLYAKMTKKPRWPIPTKKDRRAVEVVEVKATIKKPRTKSTEEAHVVRRRKTMDPTIKVTVRKNKLVTLTEAADITGLKYNTLYYRTRDRFLISRKKDGKQFYILKELL